MQYISPVVQAAALLSALTPATDHGRALPGVRAHPFPIARIRKSDFSLAKSYNLADDVIKLCDTLHRGNNYDDIVTAR